MRARELRGTTLVLLGKKILLIVENNSVPFDRRVWREALTLRDAGAIVAVICPVFGEDKTRYEVVEEIEVYRYPIKFSDGTVIGYFKEYVLAFSRTTWLLHKILFTKKHIDVVHVANPPDIFWPLAPYLRIFRTKFIFDEHDLSPETYLSRFEIPLSEGGLVFRLLRMCQFLSYRLADAIISTNESYRDRVIGTKRVFARKTFVVRNGPDTRYFKSVQPSEELKRGHRFMAGYIGIMGKQDGVEYIIRAMDYLVHGRDFQQLIVYLIGTGDDLPRIKNLVATVDLGGFFVFPGRIPDAQALQILSTADICLSPDPYNPLNDISTMNKIMEYMSLGKPIVSFDLKEARVSAGDSAVYVKNNRVEAFADGILALLNDPQKRTLMGVIGRKRVAEDLCWQKQSGKLLATYNHLLSVRSDSRSRGSLKHKALS
jgi:glycosyltransferase involved in cell wall biosynthesis